MTQCPCGTGNPYSQCCEPYIQGKKAAPTPEALMRSRYSAFTQANIDYVVSTMKGGILKNFDPPTAKKWAESVKWLDLKIVNAPTVNKGDDKGHVEFVASYLLQDRLQNIHEISEFHLEDGRWYYVDGEDVKRDTADKIGRNDPCPCGSSKKFKKCCGQ